MNWRDLSATSHYQTAVAVEQELERGCLDEAATGLRELIDALGRSEKRALKSQLVRLMVHVLKWQAQPDRRTRGWVASIANAREEIADIRAEVPSLNRAAVEELWDKCLQAAKRDAEAQTNQTIDVNQLTWQQVFEQDYSQE